MIADEQIGALRGAAGLTRMDHVSRVRCTGNGALDALARLSTRRLFVREGQMAHTLFLREDGFPLADAYIAHAEDGAYYILAEGLSEIQLVALVESVARGGVSVDGVGAELALFGVNGPYAWEVVMNVCGAAALGMPYLSVLHFEHGICLRAGKTGEYGYDLLIERGMAEAFEAELARAGEPFGLRPVGLDALDQCALENWHFNVRTLRETPLARPLTPLELQLQSRVAYKGDFVGAFALRERRAEGIRVRATAFTAAGPVRPGDAILFREHPVGEVLASGWSATCGKWVGISLISTRLAHPHIHAFVAESPAGPVALSTATPPLINNRSLYIDTNRHSYRTRERDVFPPLVVPS